MFNIAGKFIMAKKTITVKDGGDYVEGDKVAGDKIMGNKVDRQVSINGDVSGANINLGDDVVQNLTTDNHSLEELLHALAELIKTFPDSKYKQEAFDQFNTIKTEAEKPSAQRDEKILVKSISYLTEMLKKITESTTASVIISLIKNKLFGL